MNNIQVKDIFERLRKGEPIPSNDPQAYKMREAANSTKKLLLQMNNATEPEEVRALLSQITGSKTDDSVAVFTPLYINYGRHTKIGKNVFINFDCTFLDLGGITIEDNVLMICKCILDDLLKVILEVLGLLKLISEFLQFFCHNGVQCNVRAGNGLRRSQHTEFELIACESHG